jgi:phospholipase/lecithinase/hemolysin
MQSAVTLRQQIQHLKEYKARLSRAKGDTATNHTITHSLYIFSVGASDFLGNYLLYPMRRRRFTLPEYEAYLAGEAESAVRDVYELGARRVRIVGLPPLGCLPLLRTVNAARPGECSGGHNTVAKRFNRRLRALAWKLNLELPGARVAYVDQYRLMATMIHKPWEYG